MIEKCFSLDPRGFPSFTLFPRNHLASCRVRCVRSKPRPTEKATLEELSTAAVQLLVQAGEVPNHDRKLLGRSGKRTATAWAHAALGIASLKRLKSFFGVKALQRSTFTPYNLGLPGPVTNGLGSAHVQHVSPHKPWALVSCC